MMNQELMTSEMFSEVDSINALAEMYEEAKNENSRLEKQNAEYKTQIKELEKTLRQLNDVLKNR